MIEVGGGEKNGFQLKYRPGKLLKISAKLDST